MAVMRCTSQIVLLSVVLLHITSSLPLESSNDDKGFLRNQMSSSVNTHSLFPQSYIKALMDTQIGQLQGPGAVERRQLGDIEFSNRYAEYLRARAKQSSICAFLRRLQAMKKSGLRGEAERVNELLTQYMCPDSYVWTSDL